VRSVPHLALGLGQDTRYGHHAVGVVAGRDARRVLDGAQEGLGPRVLLTGHAVAGGKGPSVVARWMGPMGCSDCDPLGMFWLELFVLGDSWGLCR
jgi:hypothetical protein